MAALFIGYLCISSIAGGLIRPLMAFFIAKRLFFFVVPFTAGASGILYLLN
jgi:uncharacterized membrane protein